MLITYDLDQKQFLTASTGYSSGLTSMTVKHGSTPDWQWHRAVLEEEAMRGMVTRLARVLGVLLKSSNLRLHVVALMYAMQKAQINGYGSMRYTAKELTKETGQSVTVANLSKIARYWVKNLELPPGEGMKSLDAVATYSKTQKEKHWRKGAGRKAKLLKAWLKK